MARGRFVDVTGARFGRLTAEKYLGGSVWRCKCDCGRRRDVLSENLRHPNPKKRTKTCNQAGCRNQIHGMSETPTYVSWDSMKRRCHDVNHKGYHNYGGRGIKVCKRWLGRNGFQNFVADVGERPSPYHSIDRIKVNGNYTPSNCRWATATEQARNSRPRRHTVYVTHRGKTLSARTWDRKMGLPPGTIRSRLYHGWTPHKAITTPRLPVGRPRKPKPA